MRTTLYEFAGGGAAFLALATAHHARCLADPELNHPFSQPGQHPQHVERLAAYWTEVLGGPPLYSRECGTQWHVLDMHARNGDMSDLGHRFVACFDHAMDDAKLPVDPEFRATMHAYMVWAVDDVLVYSPHDSGCRRTSRYRAGRGTACKPERERLACRQARGAPRKSVSRSIAAARAASAKSLPDDA